MKLFIKFSTAYARNINFYKLYNYILLIFSFYLSKFIGKPIHKGNPFAVTIEPIVGCNLKCKGCEIGQNKLIRKHEEIKIDDFFIALNKLPNSIFHINLYFQGEPLLNNEIFKMIRLAKRKKMFVSISTNGHLLSIANCKELIRAGVSHIIVSLDGHNQETYSQYRVNGDFNLVLNNIKNLIRLRNKTRKRFPIIEIQTVFFSSNEQNIAEIKKIAKSIGADKYSTKTAFANDLNYIPDYLPKNEKKCRYTITKENKLIPKHKTPQFCFRSWSSLVILNNLECVACCFDKNNAYPLGNIKEVQFEEIWEGEMLKRLRSNLYKQKDFPKFCKNCI